jgi:hypothetical protein
MSASGTHLDPVYLTALIGPAVPLVAAVLKQNRFSRRANALIGMAVAAAAAVVGLAAGHLLGPLNLVVGFVVVYTTALAFQQGLWGPTGLAARVQTLTSVRQHFRPAGGGLPSGGPAAGGPGSGGPGSGGPGSGGPAGGLPNGGRFPAGSVRLAPAPTRRNDLARC